MFGYASDFRQYRPTVVAQSENRDVCIPQVRFLRGLLQSAWMASSRKELLNLED
jgi:hypothetical protein